MTSPQKQVHASVVQSTVFLRPPPAFNTLVPGLDRRYVPSVEEEQEFKLTMDDLSKNRSFNIFQDPGEASPARTEASLEEHRYA